MQPARSVRQKAFHFPRAGRVVRPRVDQRDAESLAAQAQRFAAVGAPVIKVNGVGGAVATQRGQEQVEHVSLALSVECLERDHEARRVVEHRVDAERPGRLADPQGRAMAHVAVPQRAGVIGLPAQAGVAVDHDAALEAGRRGTAAPTVVSETTPAASRPSATSVRRISGTDAAGARDGSRAGARAARA